MMAHMVLLIVSIHPSISLSDAIRGPLALQGWRVGRVLSCLFSGARCVEGVSFMSCYQLVICKHVYTYMCGWGGGKRRDGKDIRYRYAKTLTVVKRLHLPSTS